jgi:hypothetical protein
MFRTLKYINYAHREYYSKIPVSEAAGMFLAGTGILPGVPVGNSFDARDLLIRLRQIQRETSWPD